MKNNMKKIIVGLLSFIFLLVGQSVFATSLWNNGSQGTECPDINIASGSNGWGSPCWNGTNITVQPGSTISVKIYYHNASTNTTATNTHIRVIQPSGSSTSHSFSGQILSPQGNLYTGNVTANVSSAQTLTYSSTTWYIQNSSGTMTQQSLLSGQSGAEVVGPDGLYIGDIVPGWANTQGAVVVNFIVSNTIVPPPQTCTTSISASPMSIQSGGSSTITWTSTSGCNNVLVSGPNLNSSTSSGYQTVYPTNTTNVYTISASGTNGAYVPSQSVTVNVASLVTTGTLTATPNYCTIPIGSSNCLIPFYWNTINPPQGSVSAVTNNGNTIATGNSGNQSFNISNGSQTYYLYNSAILLAQTSVTASCAFGSTWNGSSCVANITNICSLSISASPMSIQSGGSSTITWTSTSGCNNVLVSGPNLNSSTSSGYQTVYPTNTTNVYTISASGTNGAYVPSQSVTVNVNNIIQNNCYITNFTANGSYSTTVQSGNVVNLVWNTTGNNCTANISGPNFSSTSLNGNQPIYPTYSGTYVLTLYGSTSGTQTQSVYVNVNNVQYNNCTISSFTASPTTVNYGGLSTLSWSTNNCSSISITNIGSVNSYGSQIVYPTYTTTYVLTAYGTNGGQQSQSVTVSVNNYVQPPTPIYNTCAVTGIATNISRNSVTLNGLLTNSSSNSASTYFEYGTDVTLGLQTNSKSTYGNSSFSDILTGLSSNTIYYYRLVSNCGNGGISRGSIEIFQTTGATTTNTTTIIRQGTTIIGVDSPIMLKIENRYQSFRVGDSVDYTITYKNISNRTLTHPLLQVILPKGVTFLNSSRGTYSSDSYTLTVSLEDLVPNVEGVVYVQGRVDSINTGNAQIVTTALLVYTNRNGAQENAMAYVLNNPIIENTGFFLGAAALFGSFFGMGIIGWMLLLVLILLAILLFRKVYRKEQL